MARRRSSLGGVLFACWLALGASGDDFHLVRIAAPFLPVETPGDPLPLDDPNTDFTEAGDSGGSLLPRAHSPGGLIPPTRTRARVARLFAPIISAPPLLTTLAADVRLPLRC
jgi:hypothetical protein